MHATLKFDTCEKGCHCDEARTHTQGTSSVGCPSLISRVVTGHMDRSSRRTAECSGSSAQRRQTCHLASDATSQRRTSTLRWLPGPEGQNDRTEQAVAVAVAVAVAQPILFGPLTRGRPPPRQAQASPPPHPFSVSVPVPEAVGMVVDRPCAWRLLRSSLPSPALHAPAHEEAEAGTPRVL